MSTAIKTQSDLTNVQQFNCTGCGASLSVINPRAKYIACQYCGSVLDADSEEHQILEALGKPDRHKPFSFIRLGQEATFNGKTYQVIARTRWLMKYKEYWVEEGESGYSNEVWIYDEWLMIDANRTYFYLVEDKSGYMISEEIIPETPTLLTNDLRMSFFQKQPRQIVREYGGAEVTHFEGESNYAIKKGDRIQFAMFRERGIEYSAEWRLDDSGQEIKEVEFFREIPISRRKVVEAFANNEEIEKLKIRESKWQFVFNVAAATGVVLLILFLYSLASNGNLIHEQEFSVVSIKNENEVISQPISIEEPGMYQLDMDIVFLTENSSTYIFAYILDENKTAISTIDGDFYHETGYDDEGKWTESSTSSSKIFRLQEPGTYYVQLFQDTPTSAMGTLKIGLRSGILLSRYFLIGFFICLIAAAIAYNNKG
ncbi:MAG: hypothetical protein KDE26_06920 [Bacteroidetes bacterium]|nr:hypothetical protein [Bacteroidota bacterium]MCB0842977.1 hypothetical protein [Bacteroidota bacterium]